MLLFFPQVGDQIVEINGEPTQGITHTRAIELIQAGGNKVLLLLRPGTGLIPDHSMFSQGLFSVENTRQGSGLRRFCGLFTAVIGSCLCDCCAFVTELH